MLNLHTIDPKISNTFNFLFLVKTSVSRSSGPNQASKTIFLRLFSWQVVVIISTWFLTSLRLRVREAGT